MVLSFYSEYIATKISKYLHISTHEHVCYITYTKGIKQYIILKFKPLLLVYIQQFHCNSY